VRWGDALLQTLRSARPAVDVVVERAGPGAGTGRDDQVEAVWRLQSGDHEEWWLVSEGRWADSFPAASYADLVSWSVRALPWALGIHCANQFWEAAREKNPRVKVWAEGLAVAKLIAALAAAPVFIVLLALGLVVGLLPIPRLRELVLSAQGGLMRSVGESLAFVESPARASLIRTRIVDALGHLRNVCDRTIVVAHSQGAAVTLEALGGILESAPSAGEQQPPPSSKRRHVPNTLVTFGSGVTQLASLKLRSAGLPPTIAMDPVALPMMSLLLALGALAWFLVDVAAGRVTLGAGALAIGIFVAAVCLSTVVTVPMVKRGKALSKGRQIVLTVVCLAAVSGFTVAKNLLQLPYGPVVFLMALLFCAASIIVLLSKHVRASLETKCMPPGLGRWIDFYASADPVSNGPTRTSTEGVPTSTKTWNLGSTLGDHTSYWNNLDGFVLEVAKACAETAQSRWGTALPSNRDAVAIRSQWRVVRLRIVRGTLVFGWIGIAAGLWPRARTLALPAWTPDWISGSAARPWLFACAIAAGWWLSCRLVRWPWAIWVRSEQRAILAGKPRPRPAVLGPAGMGLVWWSVVLFALALARGNDPAAIFAKWNDWSFFLAVMAVISAIALQWTKEPKAGARPGP
jgi:hypothetical protein